LIFSDDIVDISPYQVHKFRAKLTYLGSYNLQIKHCRASHWRSFQVTLMDIKTKLI